MYSNASVFDERSVFATKSKDYAHIDDNLYIGNANSVSNDEFLTKAAIALIVNASNRSNVLSNLQIPTIQVLDFEDAVPAAGNELTKYRNDVLAKAESVAEQIHKYITNGQNVLVHCQAGVNRSAFILSVYMITKRGHPPHTAVKMIKDANSTQRDTIAFSNPILENIALTLAHSPVVAPGVRCPNCKRSKFTEYKKTQLMCIHCRYCFDYNFNLGKIV